MSSNNITLNVMQSIDIFLIKHGPKVLADYVGTTQPATPKKDESWYNDVLEVIKVWSGTAWVVVPADYFLLDWDAHANVKELPTRNLIGQSGGSLEEDSDGMINYDCAILVASFNDLRLIKLRQAMNYFFDVFRHGQDIPIFKVAEGTRDVLVYGRVKQGTAILPVIKSDQRPMQAVSITIGCTAV